MFGRRAITTFGLLGAEGGGGGLPTGNLELDVNPAIGAFQDFSSSVPCTNNTACYTLANQGTTFNFQQSSSSRRPQWFSSSSAQNNKPYLDFTEDFMISQGGAPLGVMDGDDGSLYCVVKFDSGASTYDTIMDKNTDWDWDDGWRLAVNTSEDWVTNVGGGGQSENEIENEDTTTTQAEVYTLRFRASTTPYVNTSFSSWSIGNTETGTTTGFANKSTPFKHIMFGTSWNSSGTGASSFRWNGLVFRILGYNTFHDNATHDSIVATLKTEYGI